MYNYKQKLGITLLALGFASVAQTPAKELVKNNPLTQIERGHSIDTYGEYTILGSNFGFGINGAAMLFQNNQHIRDYKVSSSPDWVGTEKTLSIDQHALVVAAPKYQEGGVEIGKVGVAAKTWDGTHYSPNFSQFLTEGSGQATGFGSAVSISDNFIAVGAPTKGSDGGVRMYYRNPGTGIWEDKGWLSLPDFSVATYRYSTTWWGGLIVNAAAFGDNVSILHNNLIVSAKGLGTFYIYQFNGTSWQYVYQYQGTKFLTGPISISDEYAAVGIGGGFDVEVFKKQWGNTPWVPFQTITLTGTPASSVATEGTRLVVGQASSGDGVVNYYELRSYQQPNSNNWVYNFLRVGRMFVSTSASPNGLKNHKLLGKSVAMHGNTVVAGAPNASYTGSADGAGFRADFYQMLPVSAGGREEELEQAAGHLTLYPNPASNSVNVNGKEIISATATNTLGQTFKLGVNGSQLDISGLSSGVYAITLESVEGTQTTSLSVK